MQSNGIRNIDVLKNIWFNKVYRMIFISVLIFTGLSHKAMHEFIFKQFDNELMGYILNEAKQVGNHISAHQGVTVKVEVLQIAMDRILKDFNIMKIKLFDKDGVIIHSTKAEEIGTKNKHDYFYDIVQKGQMFYKIAPSGLKSLEGEKQIHDVAEIYVPIMLDNTFLGASEIYYDITEKRASLDALIESADRIFMFVIFIAQIAIFIMLYFTSKNSLLRELNNNKAKEMENLVHKQARFVALADMIGNVAHHWRQPLSVITTAITGLKIKGEFGAPLVQEDISAVNDIIVRTAQNLSDTINVFEDLMKEGKQETFNISKTIKSSIELLNIANKNFDCNFEFKLDEKLEIFGVESELSQVIINILTNSYEAFERKNIEKKIVQIKLERIENNICLNIIDNAGGVEDSIIDKIFDPYFTTKHKFQGTGLGLFVCSQIVIEHFHGNITCENILKDDEKGCRFLITFPTL